MYYLFLWCKSYYLAGLCLTTLISIVTPEILPELNVGTHFTLYCASTFVAVIVIVDILLATLAAENAMLLLSGSGVYATLLKDIPLGSLCDQSIE